MVSQLRSDDAGRVLDGRYRIVALVGSGACGRVHRAQDTVLRRPVAVRIFDQAQADDSNFVSRLERVAEAAASFDHPHVLGVSDRGDDGGPYLVTDYLDGGSLQAIVDAGHRLSPSQVLMVALEAARGIAYLHGQSLVHEDVKPSNLLFDTRGRLRVADFGLSRLLASDPDSLSPFQWADDDLPDPKVDIRALGLTIVEAVTADAVDVEALGTSFDPGPALGPMQEVVARMLSEDRDARPGPNELIGKLLRTAEILPRPEPLPRSTPAVDDMSSTIPTPAGSLSEEPPGPAPSMVGGSGSGSAPTPIVVSSAPRPSVPLDDVDDTRRGWPRILLAALVVLGGGAGALLAWQNSRQEIDTVPDLLGRTEIGAAAAITALGWEPEAVLVREPGTRPGEVVRTEPEGGVALESGREVRLFVSLGEPLVRLPDVTGLSVTRAEAELEALGFVVSGLVTVQDESLSAGVVVRIDGPSYVTELEAGSEVGLVVSSRSTTQ